MSRHTGSIPIPIASRRTAKQKPTGLRKATTPSKAQLMPSIFTHGFLVNTRSKSRRKEAVGVGGKDVLSSFAFTSNPY